MQLAIADGHQVALHFRLTLDDGSIVDDSFDDDPLVYVHGSQTIVPGLERELTGRTAGDECRVVVDPEDGYGPHDPTMERPVPRSMFPDDSELEPGTAFQATGPDGAMQLWVKEVDGDEVVVTANHPLAGKRLTFDVRVVDVREAADDEGASPET
ncbi:MAG: peptidylprolyl isomerase [Planctomycetota bacterium]